LGIIPGAALIAIKYEINQEGPGVFLTPAGSANLALFLNRQSPGVFFLALDDSLLTLTLR